ncbi:family 3 encapsulin nanocompartment shell protein [Streptomyces sp. TR02-1]|uniref:family 3 encapsulin nanocompartment shell protein n=1 Tax=Streptomyces sp. TR02-1 TaxID=3385977 RepID=UPI0039A2F0D3
MNQDAAPQGSVPTPGEEFARAFAENPEKAEVRFDYTLTDTFRPGKERHRLTARNLFRKQPADSDVVRSWHETRPDPEHADTASGLREDAFRFSLAEYRVTPIDAWVQIPEGLGDEPAGLAAFIDRRLMVRLGTAENRALTHQVVHHPDVAELPYRNGYETGLLAAFDEIEQSGGTGHAIMVNPSDYYGRLAGSGSLLDDLAREGVMVCRHRQVERGCALVGDFAMAAVLLDARRSAIRVAEPPAGTFDGSGTAVCATVHESVAVQLPTHFFHVVPA